MAEFQLLRNVDCEAHIKVVSDDASVVSVTIDDLCHEYQETPKDRTNLYVTIRSVQWTGASDTTIKVYRGETRVMTLQAAPCGTLIFDGQQFVSESTEKEKDFRFEFSGEGEVWMTLRKHGFIPKSAEYATYGAYEDETRVGAKTNISGSPDYGKIQKRGRKRK